jgi:hypothetical protein
MKALKESKCQKCELKETKIEEPKKGRPLIIREGIINPMEKLLLLIMVFLISVATTVGVLFLLGLLRIPTKRIF